jgi:hypothetical protein
MRWYFVCCRTARNSTLVSTRLFVCEIFLQSAPSWLMRTILRCILLAARRCRLLGRRDSRMGWRSNRRHIECTPSESRSFLFLRLSNFFSNLRQGPVKVLAKGSFQFGIVRETRKNAFGDVYFAARRESAQFAHFVDGHALFSGGDDQSVVRFNTNTSTKTTPDKRLFCDRT